MPQWDSVECLQSNKKIASSDVVALAMANAVLARGNNIIAGIRAVRDDRGRFVRFGDYV